MSTHCFAVSFALLLSACAAHDDGSKPEGSVPVAVKPEAVKPAPLAAVTVAVASVQLIQDCPDPAEEATPAAEEAKPAGSATAASRESPMLGQAGPSAGLSAKRSGAGPGGWSGPCTQSTMQLALRNPGEAGATLRVEAVRLVDGASKRALAPIVARKPSVWSPDGIYRPWDERVPVAADLKVGYRLAEPDWEKVREALISGVNLYAQPFVLEVDVSIDGARQTLRSPEFLRERVHMIAT